MNTINVKIFYTISQSQPLDQYKYLIFIKFIYKIIFVNDYDVLTV